MDVEPLVALEVHPLDGYLDQMMDCTEIGG